MASPQPSELQRLTTALAKVRQDLLEVDEGPGLQSARSALLAGTDLLPAQSAVLDYWRTLLDQEKDLASRLTAAKTSTTSSHSEPSEAKGGATKKRAALIAEAVSRRDPVGLNWSWVRSHQVGGHKAGSIDTAARDQHQRATKCLRIYQAVNDELDKPAADVNLREKLRQQGAPESSDLADALDRCQALAQEGIFQTHLACTTAELSFTDDWPTANLFYEKAQHDQSQGLSKLMEDARSAALKAKDRRPPPRDPPRRSPPPRDYYGREQPRVRDRERTDRDRYDRDRRDEPRDHRPRR